MDLIGDWPQGVFPACKGRFSILDSFAA